MVNASCQYLLLSWGNCIVMPNCRMHNGFVACFNKIRKKTIMHMSDFAYDSIQGTSDSEHW